MGEDPIPSPLRDDGYDITDDRNVHASYGTLDGVEATRTDTMAHPCG